MARHLSHWHRGIFLAATLLTCAPPLFAQRPLPSETAGTAPEAELPVFDTVSIRENKSGEPMIRFSNTLNGVEYTNMQVLFIVSIAYGMRQNLISGLPDWTKDAHFDIHAKVADEDLPTYKKLSSRQHGDMMVAVLQDRFKLQAHKEFPVLPTYDLVVDKSGPKLAESTAKPYTPGEPFDPSSKTRRAGMVSMARGHFTATGVPVKTLIEQITGAAGRSIVDKTGLTGKYDFDLRWTPEGTASTGTDSASDEAPDIFTAVHEQLGLKLVPNKGPVETLVVDHIEKPSEN